MRSIRLSATASALQKMTITLDEEFPLLLSLAIIHTNDSDPGWVTLPKSLRAPNSRHLLKNVIIQTGTPILTTSIPLTILLLERIPTSTHIPPGYLVDLSVSFRLPIPGGGLGTHPLRLAPEAQRKFITLRCLESLHFMGTSAYLESLLAR
jgi:hypothetical protein